MDFQLGQVVEFPAIQLFGLPYKIDERHLGKILKIEESNLGKLYTVKIIDTGAIRVFLKYYGKQLTLKENETANLSTYEQDLLNESLA